jgi:hypothetical protein
MRDHFTQTAVYVGDELFDGEALAYIEAHPSQARNLGQYGCQWPHWLAQRYPDDPDVSDLARLEWALRRAFDSADHTPLTLADLAQIPPPAWDTLRLALSPSAQVIDCGHTTIPLWHALAHGDAPPEAAHQPGWVLVWRQGWQPHFRSLAPDEAQALQALMQGRTFAQVCADICSPTDQSADSIGGQWLYRWITDGLIKGYHQV